MPLRRYPQLLRVLVSASVMRNVVQALQWQAELTLTEIMQQRECMVAQLERADAELRASGRCAQWFSGCDATTLAVSGTMNGYLLQELVTVSGHCDTECANFFRSGACVSLQVHASLFVASAHWHAQVQHYWGSWIAAA